MARRVSKESRLFAGPSATANTAGDPPGASGEARPGVRSPPARSNPRLRSEPWNWAGSRITCDSTSRRLVSRLDAGSDGPGSSAGSSDRARTSAPSDGRAAGEIPTPGDRALLVASHRPQLPLEPDDHPLVKLHREYADPWFHDCPRGLDGQPEEYLRAERIRVADVFVRPIEEVVKRIRAAIREELDERLRGRTSGWASWSTVWCVRPRCSALSSAPNRSARQGPTEASFRIEIVEPGYRVPPPGGSAPRRVPV